MLTFALTKMLVKNNLWLQSIMEDGKNAKSDHVGKIMPCPFFQLSSTFNNFEYHLSHRLWKKTTKKTKNIK